MAVLNFENDTFQGFLQNPKDCEGCKYMTDEPLRGDCKKYPVAKPYSVYFEGKSCSKRKSNE